MAGNNGRTLTGTFQRVLSMRSSGIPIRMTVISNDFYFEDAQAKIVSKIVKVKILEFL